MKRIQHFPFPFLQNSTFVSAIILLLNIFKTKRAGLSTDINKDLVQVQVALRVLKLSEKRLQAAGRLWELIQELQSLDGPMSLRVPPKDESHYSRMGVSESNTLLKDPPPPALMQSAGNPETSANFPSAVNEVYPQYRRPFEPGTSIEQLLADTPVLDTSLTADGWGNSSDAATGILDDELMSMWMAVPTDFMNIDEWDAYIENINLVDVNWSDAH